MKAKLAGTEITYNLDAFDWNKPRKTRKRAPKPKVNKPQNTTLSISWGLVKT